MCTRGQSVFSYKHLHRGVHLKLGQSYFVGISSAHSCWHCGSGSRENPNGKMGLERDQVTATSREWARFLPFHLQDECVFKEGLQSNVLQRSVFHTGDHQQPVYEIVIKFLILTNMNTKMYDKHTHVHIYIAQKTTSKSPVKAEFVKSGCRIKKKKRGIHWTATTCEVFCCVLISHDSNPSYSFMCQQTDLFHKTKKRSRCLQSHLVAPFGNRTGLKAWKDNQAEQMVLRYVTYSPSPFYSSLFYR